MKKNLKICIEQPMADEPLCLVDMNKIEVIEAAGMQADLVHKRSAHISAAWRYADRTHVSIDMDGADLSAYRYLTFAVFSVGGAGGSFSLFFDSSTKENPNSGYEQTFGIYRDGWNEYRVELPFMRAIRKPLGWDNIGSIDFDCVFGGQANKENTVLYFDNLFVWKQSAAPLYTTMPEIKGAAAFSKSGGFAIVNRQRVSLSIDGSDVRPFEEGGTWWIPMGAIAAVMAHSAVADNKAQTLTFTYRRKKYAFEASSKTVLVDGTPQTMDIAPVAREGILFFTSEYVRDFFHWRQIFTDPMGLIVFSNRKDIFDRSREFDRIWQLIADMTFFRPTGESVMNDLHKKISNPEKGRVLATYEELMALRKLAKTDADLKALVTALKEKYAPATDAPFDFETASDRMLSLSMLYRVTGDKQYAECAALLAEAMASLSDWQSNSMRSVARASFGMAIAYDWCHHVWSEARKAVIERAILRNGLRPALEAYNGKRPIWDAGSATGAEINAGMLAASLALSDLYPETVQKLLGLILRNAEMAMLAFAPDGGIAEGVGASERAIRSAALISRMLSTACNTDYGFSNMPGFTASAAFQMYAETQNGAWNYNDCAALPIDTSILPFFTQLTGNDTYAWWRYRQISMELKTVNWLDVLLYSPVDRTAQKEISLDRVFRRAGLAMMRADWRDGMSVFLHGGKNNDRDGDLDAGSFILECAGERFFVETGANDKLPMLLRRRAEGQNTLVVNTTEESVPDQNPGAIAPITAMRSSADRVYAVVDMTETNDAIVRAKRGVMLTEKRTVAVIQDEMTLSHAGVAVWSAYTPAKVELNASGRVAKLTLNEKTLICRLCGVGYPACFEAATVGESSLTRLSVRVDVKDKLRMAVVCYAETVDRSASDKMYDVTPMSRWEEQ